MNIELPPLYVFIEDVKLIFPDGDLVKGYNTMRDHLGMFVKLDKTPLTYQYILEKFADLHKQWNHRYGSREPRYIGKESLAEKKTIDEFIARQMYWQEFVILSAPGSFEREAYLFGIFDRNYLIKQLEEFKRQIPYESDQSAQ